MSRVEKFRTSIQALDDHLSALSTLTDQPVPPANDALAAARWAVVRTLAELAAFLEKFLLAPLEARGDLQLAAQARAIGEASQEVMQKLIKHSDRWPADAVHHDWPGFCRALPDAHRIIRDHYAWVARVALPLLENAGGRVCGTEAQLDATDLGGAGSVLGRWAGAGLTAASRALRARCTSRRSIGSRDRELHRFDHRILRLARGKAGDRVDRPTAIMPRARQRVLDRMRGAD